MKCLIYEILTFEPQNEEINVKKIVAVKVATYAVAKIKNEILSSCLTPGGGGGGRLCPKVHAIIITLLYTIFHKKGTPFVYLLLTNGTPFTYLVYNFASLLTAVNALSFK